MLAKFIGAAFIYISKYIYLFFDKTAGRDELMNLLSNICRVHWPYMIESVDNYQHFRTI
jgi:hypothetical protein